MLGGKNLIFFGTWHNLYLFLESLIRFNIWFIFFKDGPDHRGIFIKSMLQGGSAELDGRLDIGDRLLEINGISLEGLNKQQVTKIK